MPVVLGGDYNVMPTELDVYKPERWTNDALFRVEAREASLSIKAGRMHSGICIQTNASTLLGLLPQRLRPRHRTPHRPLPPKFRGRIPSREGGGRQARARLGPQQRSCSRLDRTAGESRLRRAVSSPRERPTKILRRRSPPRSTAPKSVDERFPPAGGRRRAASMLRSRKWCPSAQIGPLDR